MTKSELLFESILTKQGIEYTKIPEGSSRTPDYKILLRNKITYWEIKELIENDKEKKIKEAISSESNALYEINSLRVSNSIKSACRQFKDYGVKNYPCVIVLFDARDFSCRDFLFYQYIQSAMLGTAEYMANYDGEYVEIKRNHGLLTNRKKYISAIALLTEKTKELHFFHNPNANTPLKHSVDLSQFKSHFYAFKEKNGIIWRKI